MKTLKNKHNSLNCFNNNSKLINLNQMERNYSHDKQVIYFNNFLFFEKGFQIHPVLYN